MKKIGQLFSIDHWQRDTQKRVGGPRNERDEYVDYFFDRLKVSYNAHAKQDLTKKRVAIAISHLKTSMDLHYLKHICEDGESRGKPFSQIFWGSLKVRPEQK